MNGWQLSRFLISITSDNPKPMSAAEARKTAHDLYKGRLVFVAGLIPQGKPGFIRVDTVHQGDRDGVKGLYHINAVDEVTQYEVVCTVEKISERYLVPVLEGMLAGFPFKLLEFHSDNGSEFINHKVAELLNSLNIALTKSRSRHSNDNALVESKNGSVIRKLLGHAHVPQHHAERFNLFDQAHLNPYVNYHRPCFLS